MNCRSPPSRSKPDGFHPHISCGNAANTDRPYKGPGPASSQTDLEMNLRMAPPTACFSFNHSWFYKLGVWGWEGLATFEPQPNVEFRVQPCPTQGAFPYKEARSGSMQYPIKSLGPGFRNGEPSFGELVQSGKNETTRKLFIFVGGGGAKHPFLSATRLSNRHDGLHLDRFEAQANSKSPSKTEDSFLAGAIGRE